MSVDIGFLEIGIFDIIDITLVAILLYQLYRLLKGSLAFNIFIGLLSIFIFWFIVKALGMRLMEGILGQFIGLGFIAVLIVFQPEIRRFLLYLGRSSQFKRIRFIRNIWTKQMTSPSVYQEEQQEIKNSLLYLSKVRNGATLVFARTSELQFFANSGVEIDGRISGKLIESIFEKTSPLHDGAVIIADNKIKAASCTLPVSDNPDLPSRIGLRHKSAVGITENSDAIVLVVSEETGEISVAENGRIRMNISETELERKLRKVFLMEA